MSIAELWEILADKLTTWTESAVAMLPNLVAALLVVGLFYFLGKGVRSVTERGLKHLGMHVAARGLVTNLTHFVVLAAGLMVALSILELDKAATSLLASAGVVGLALGFAFQDLAANFISGVGLSVRHPFRKGDIIETNEVIGVAESVRLRTTTIRTFDGKLVLVPNKKIFQEILINHTENRLKRLDVTCGVSYGDDLDHVKEVALDALRAVKGRDESREPEVFFTGFGGSSIDFTARVWFEYQAQRDLLEVQDGAVRALKSAFDDHEITIPFPIRTLDFGIKGGESLGELLPESMGAGDPH